jgi:hypothetical protein
VVRKVDVASAIMCRFGVGSGVEFKTTNAERLRSLDQLVVVERFIPIPRLAA